MIVHFFTSIVAVKEDIEILRCILNAIADTDSKLAEDWIPTEHFRLTHGGSRRDWPSIYAGNMTSIEKADVVIAEVSGYSSFGVGFQVAAALQKKKPILLLQKRSSVPVTGTYPDGIEDALTVLKKYDNPDDAAVIVKLFLEENVMSSKDMRFNFVIDRQIYNHIRAKAFKTRKTKAEVVRELLLKDIESTE